VTATTLTDIFYISRRHTRSIEQARQAVSEMLTAMVICPVNRAVLESAFGSGLADFEDAIQIACAIAQRLDAILTRDTQGFLSSSLPVLSIHELLQQLGA
jgi:predicted nucleic acid-binding protein